MSTTIKKLYYLICPSAGAGRGELTDHPGGTMDPAIPELPRRPRRARPRRATVLMATAGTALLAVTGIAAAAAAQEGAPRSAQVANLTVATTSALTSNWYESAPYYSVLDSAGPDLGSVMSATGQKAFD